VRSLNRFLAVRKVVLGIRGKWLFVSKGIKVPNSVRISLSARLMPGRRGAITIGEHTLIAFKSLVIAESADGKVRPISIGRNCFIGGGSVILPGVTIGDNVIIGAGSVVFEDVPSRTIAAGNPAKVVREEINVGLYGRLDYADENQKKYWVKPTL